MIIQGSREQLAERAALILHETTLRLLREKENVVIAVPGGQSVAGIYDRFWRYKLPWGRISLFLLDERLVASDHPDSNYKLVHEHMGNGEVDVLIHPFVYDAKRPMQSVVDYKEKLDRCGGRFDIVLASSGEDGHIGSLFPNHHVLDENPQGFILLDDSPKPPAGRMSAGFDLIRQADTGVVLFFGSTKGEALQRFLDTELSYKEIPAKVITELPHYYVLTDQEVNVP